MPDLDEAGCDREAEQERGHHEHADRNERRRERGGDDDESCGHVGAQGFDMRSDEIAGIVDDSGHELDGAECAEVLHARTGTARAMPST